MDSLNSFVGQVPELNIAMSTFNSAAKTIFNAAQKLAEINIPPVIELTIAPGAGVTLSGETALGNALANQIQPKIDEAVMKAAARYFPGQNTDGSPREP